MLTADSAQRLLDRVDRHPDDRHVEQRQRLAGYTTALAGFRAEFDALHDRLEPTAVAVFEHSILRHETEIAWHRRLLEQVGAFGARREPSDDRP